MTTTTAKLIPASLAREIARQADEPGTTPSARASSTASSPRPVTPRTRSPSWRARRGTSSTCASASSTCARPDRTPSTCGTLPVGLAWYVSRLSLPNQRVMLARWDRGDFADAHQASDHASALRELEAPTD